MDAQPSRRRPEPFQEGDLLVLVPGIFGFASFGSAPGLTYFGRAQAVLTEELPRAQIHVHEPPPTGSLDRRVRTLHAWIRDHAPAGKRVHIVGHSTGGLDARLLVNCRFLLHGIERDERKSVWDRIGRIVTLSAPLHGTPVATHLRYDYQFGLFSFVYLAAILDKAGKLKRSEFLKTIWELMRGHRSRTSASPPAPAADLELGFVNEQIIPVVAELLGDSSAAAQVVRFFRNIEGDARLIYDLTPPLMAELNASISGADLPMDHFVTVAPPPAVELSALVDEPILRWIFRHFYRGTAAGPFVAPPPPAYLPKAIGVEQREWQAAPLPNDGVVPTASQALDWESATLVFGDHLDVVGHYPSTSTTALFKSGASFRDPQFHELWTAIAMALRS